MSVLETKVDGIEADVSEIKADVKDLMKSQAEVAAALSTRQAIEDALSSSRHSTGVWLRFFSERIVAIVALGAAVYSIVKG